MRKDEWPTIVLGPSSVVRLGVDQMDFTLPEELTMVRDTVRDFVTNELLPIERDALVRDAERGGTRGAPIPHEKRERLRKLAIEQGLWAMTAPEALGGGGLNTLGACLVAEELGKAFVDFDFGDIPPMLFDANAVQREKYLKPAIAGEKEVALALREPDGYEIRAHATRDDDAWRLNGTKLANEADVYLVFAQAEEGATCFILECGWEGAVTQDRKLMLIEVRVPVSNVLGEIGGAFALGRKYQNARWVRAAARKVGIAARLLEISTQYARDWKALGQPLAIRPAAQRHLAEMAIEIDAARWLVYHAVCEIDAGKEAREVACSRRDGTSDSNSEFREASARQAALRANLFASEMAQRAIDRTIEIYGGPAHAADLPMLRVYGVGAKADDSVLELQRFQVANSLVSR
jgi:alkylation response protein AidB-like acyl-CoA dehydrogenase